MFLDKLILRGFVQHLAAISVGLTGCPADASSLTDLPDKVVEEILDDAVEAEWNATDRKIALMLATDDPRAPIRLRAVRNSATCGLDFDDVEPLLQRLAGDPDVEVRAAVAESLAEHLQHSTILERTAVIGDWVNSDQPHVRLAVARALERPIEALELSLAFEELAVDPVLEVRRAAADAARARSDAEPELLCAFLSRQMTDLDPDSTES
jgi:HEAT repeat protein